MARPLRTGIACLLGIGIPALGLVFSSPNAPEKPSTSSLTFAKRIAYQRAIEEVYWRHRIWPKENARPKPPLRDVISEAQIEKKVEDYLRDSQALEAYWHKPIAAEQLQAEMQRMARDTKQPEVLRELFDALGDDPFAIAECLARPILTERSLAELCAPDKDRHSALLRTQAAGGKLSITTLGKAIYTLPQTDPCMDDTWTPTSVINAPDARFLHTVVWTGTEMIIWGGFNSDNNQANTLNTGGRYDPTTDNWTPTSTTNAPIGRDLHTAIWTGSQMIVWGGYNYPALDLNDGGQYNPITDSWTATSTVNAPVARRYHTAVWTGSEMIIWGGFSNPDDWFNTGGRYDPNTDTWTATSTTNAPEARWEHTVKWTGSEMIVWGGTNQTNYLNTGGRYNPSTDSWTPTGLVNTPLGRIAHTAIWSGSEMIVWGGVDSTFNDCNTGGRYDPGTDSWVATSLTNAPSPRDSHNGVWTGSEMIAWGGIFCYPCLDFNNGGRYNPGTDSWVPTSTANAPQARDSHTAVWTGSQMIVWGGIYQIGNNIFFLNTGGRYCALGGPTATPTPTATATPTITPSPSPTATPTITPAATPSSTPTATLSPSPTPTPTVTPTTTATATATPTSTPRPSSTPRTAPSPRGRPTPLPRP